ncbi:MAG: GNAT family N-acetyltransferase [Bacteroidales bacterium]|nr:GNAT family N-acetyltransferase [Bacteroidales bacterium]
MGIVLKTPSDTITGTHKNFNDVSDARPETEIIRPQVELRPGRPSDAGFIAETVLNAMGNGPDTDFTPFFADETDYQDVIEAMTVIAAMEDTLYSYRNVYVAVCGDSVAGAMVAYDGARYKKMADRTFGLLSEILGVEKLNPGEETGPDEYYLDSLYVNPEFRGHSIGSILMQNELEIAQGLGFTAVSLLVDRKKPWLHRLYSKLGFTEDGETMFFGEPYLRMVQYI